MNPWRVSVVIPAYNAEVFLDSALASVAGQIRTADEVIVIDDGSTDTTGDIARRWSSSLPLRVITKSVNAGLGEARTTGIDAATGDAIALLDADDFWLPDHLEAVLSRLDDDKTIVTPGAVRWYPAEGVATVASHHMIPIPAIDEQRLAILDANFVFSGSTFSKAAYDDVGGFRAFRKNEDWDLWIRMITSGCRVVTPPLTTVLYRQHPGSLSSGDGCLPHDIETLEGLAAERDGDEARVVRRALRRRKARLHLVTAFEQALAGQSMRARVQFFQAAAIDRSLRGGTSVANGSVTLRAVPGIAVPGWLAERRRERIADPNLKQTAISA